MAEYASWTKPKAARIHGGIQYLVIFIWKSRFRPLLFFYPTTALASTPAFPCGRRSRVRLLGTRLSSRRNCWNDSPIGRSSLIQIFIGRRVGDLNGHKTNGPKRPPISLRTFVRNRVLVPISPCTYGPSNGSTLPPIKVPSAQSKQIQKMRAELRHRRIACQVRNWVADTCNVPLMAGFAGHPTGPRLFEYGNRPPAPGGA